MTSVYRHLMRSGLRQMARFPLRSLLVIGCAALGVAGAVTSVNYASGGREQVMEQIRRLGLNLVVVSAAQSRAVAGRARTGDIVTTLVEPDYRALREEFPEIRRSSALVSSTLRLKAGYLSKMAPVYGVEPDYFPMKSWAPVAGDLFGAEELRRSARVAVLGHTVAADLYPDDTPLGKRLFINRVPFEVVGVLEERGPGLDATNEDGQVFVPLTSAMRRLLNVDHYASILLELEEPEALEWMPPAITELMRTRHRISAFRPDDFQVQTQTSLIEARLSAAERLDFLVRWIAFSGLAVAGLGILAIAWISVRDRTREIGTRRALGATAPTVFFQFAFEAGVLASCGVLLGVGLGYAATRIVTGGSGLPFVFDGGNALLALTVALLLNLGFASWPALRAARMDPIVALRHE